MSRATEVYAELVIKPARKPVSCDAGAGVRSERTLPLVQTLENVRDGEENRVGVLGPVSSAPKASATSHGSNAGRTHLTIPYVRGGVAFDAQSALFYSANEPKAHKDLVTAGIPS